VSIAVRVWLVQRDSVGVQNSGRRLFGNTIAIIVESGQSVDAVIDDTHTAIHTAAIYSIFTIMLIASASYQSALMYAVLNPVGFDTSTKHKYLLSLQMPSIIVSP
jgi:hypothetical protein